MCGGDGSVDDRTAKDRAAQDSGPGSAGVADAGAPAPAADPGLLADLVVANRILFDQGVVDAFGHVSVRHDKDPARFLLARSMAPALVTEADIVEHRLDGTPVDAAGRAVYLERFIHGAVYRARPDVQAVVHSHAPAVIPFGAVAGAPLRPLWHMCGFLARGAPVFEIREAAGEASDLLIRSQALGDALAGSLGTADVVLMRGHGATLVGPSLRHAVYRAVYTQMNATLQLQAMQLGATSGGDVTFLTEAEGLAADEANSGQLERAWKLWKSAVGA